jgi:hypothetical protein
MSPARFLLLLLTACAFSSCAFLYSHELHKRYHRVRVTNIEGRLVAEWIAEGFVEKTETGYKFNAVQRTSAPPYPQEIHYPYRRRIEVGGPNIYVSRCGKPLWLYRLEGY